MYIYGKWFLVANVDISYHQNKYAPTPKGSHPYFDSSAPHIGTQPRQRLVLWNKAKPMLLTYREETKQPLRPIAGLPAPWVLSSAGKLIRYLHGSYFLPYRNTVSKPDASSAAWLHGVSLLLFPQTFSSFVFCPPSLSFCHRSARLMSVMCTERSLLCIMSRHAPYCWLATSLFWYLARLSFLKCFWKNTYPTFKRKELSYFFKLTLIWFLTIENVYNLTI